MSTRAADSKQNHSSAWHDFWRRFAQHRLALAGVIIIMIIVMLAFAAPLIIPNARLDATLNAPFMFQADLSPSLADFPYRLFGLTGLADYHHPVLAEVLYGARPMLLIGLGAALLTTLIGTVLGAISGYFGGWVDDIAAWAINLALSLPYLPLVIALIVGSAITSGGILALMIIFSLAGWPAVARQVRAGYLVLREQTYTEAARAVGIGDMRIIFRHLLPNAAGPILALTAFNIANFMLAIATLDYIGLDVVGQVSWGSTITEGYYNGLLSGRWWWWFFPGLFLSLAIVAFNYIGEGLSAALDTRQRLI